MESRKFDYNYSVKDIPAPSQKEYKMALIRRTEEFIIRLRWAFLFFMKPKAFNNDNKANKYKLKNDKFPDKVNHPSLEAFEKELWQMVENVEFKRTNCAYMTKLKIEKEKISNENDLIIKADKSSNMYKINKDRYLEIVQNEISKTYKRVTNPSKIKNMDLNAKNTTDKLGISERIQKTKKAFAKVQVKDHKERFPNDVEYRLLNPAIHEIGIINRKVLRRSVEALKKHLKVNLWKDSSEAVNWFKHIEEKHQTCFIQMDIKKMYSSITKQTFEKTIAWAQSFEFINISKEEIELLYKGRESILFFNQREYEKRNNPSFDVTEGSFEGAEVAELIDLMILHEIVNVKKLLKANEIAIYRDDCLIAVRINPLQQDKLRKQLIKLFKEEFKFEITIEINMKVVNFLDVTLNLITNAYNPYTKPGNQPIYVNAKSNHPPNVIKEIPTMINKRLYKLSSNETEFNNNKEIYQQALKNANYKHKLVWNDSNEEEQRIVEGGIRRNRRRSTLWYNPPFSKTVHTNVAGKFLSLVDKWFGSNPSLKSQFSTLTINSSYSTTRNMQSYIHSYNNKCHTTLTHTATYTK